MPRLLQYAVILALAGLAVYVVEGKTEELSGASVYLEDLRWYWLVVAAVAELGSIVAFAALQRCLLSAGDVDIDTGPLVGITFAGYAIQNSLPAGTVWSAVFTFRQFRHRGAGDVLAGWTLVGTTVLSQLLLVGIAGLGLAIAGGTGSALNLVGVILGMLVIAGGVLLLWTRRAAVAHHFARPLARVQRVFHRPEGDPRELIRETLDHIASVTPSGRNWAAAASMAGANWILDLACLVVAFLAVGAAVPWRPLLLAYGAAQLAANLPITPGGLGVVEGSLTIALVAYGGGRDSTVAAVLLYRLISYWALLPIGWVCWAVLRLTTRRSVRRAALRATTPPLPMADTAT